MTTCLLGRHLSQPLEVRHSCLQMDKNGQESTVIRNLRSNVMDFLGKIFSGKCFLHRELIPRVLQVLALIVKRDFIRIFGMLVHLRIFLKKTF